MSLSQALNQFAQNLGRYRCVPGILSEQSEWIIYAVQRSLVYGFQTKFSALMEIPKLEN